MKRLLVLLSILFFLVIPCNAMEFTAPAAPNSAVTYMPDETDNFAEGLRYVVASAFHKINPGFTEAIRTCLCVICVSVLVAFCGGFAPDFSKIITVTGLCITAVAILQSVNSLIHLGAESIQDISQYGKLLLPVLCGALSAQGAVTTAGSLYAATVFVNSLLSSVISNLLIPLVYIFLCIAIVSRFSEQALLKQLGDAVKGFVTWGLKIVLYVFTGYISITGVVSGTTDAAVLKATKLSISSMVPVVGGILSDASEAVIVSAGIMKNAAGIYGLLALVATGIGPFLRIGIQYLLLKLTCAICHTLGVSKLAGLIKDFSDAMGIALAMIGTVSLILMISTICFMRGSGI